MASVKRAFWLPLTRRGATFVAVVVFGNVCFDAFRSAAASIPQDSEESSDPFSRKKKRLERPFFRVLERLPESPASAPSAGEERTGAGGPGPNLGRITTTDGNGMPPRGPEVEYPGTLEPEAAPFARPAPLEAPGGPEPILPESMGFPEWPDFKAELVTDAYRRSGGDPLADVGDTLLQGPEMVFDGVFACFGSLWWGAPLRTWEEEEGRSVTARTFDVRFGPRPQRISAAFMQQWAEGERKYLGALDESRADTYGFEEGTEDADLGELAIDQRKVFWGALRRTYLTRYKMQFEEQVPGKAWALGCWSGMDFVVLPPLMVGYLYYRGLDQKISMGETALRISFEPVSELIDQNRDRSVAAGLEWTIKGFPLGIIVSVGLQEGRYEMDFVGIGTSLGAVRSAVDNQHQDSRR